ncbi:efflux RND transporter periplasmic adaptor subunit [uncultured Phocaeicola sp.]|uniref:efflux RND transporter periplasmic adaptor subunit n=1 Tax=uncultured Phocaeicola sp. TaxID=990718 RepID=UPI0015AD5E5C|nr:efflux RND transporter periplasmic adaptor subunit [uncultured Phocaeicola sp.]
MDKRIKWGILSLIGIGLIGLGVHTFIPRTNDELDEAEQKRPVTSQNKALNVNAQIIKPHLLTDKLLVSGKLIPDEEVDLSFETSGKIVDIFFTEGTLVSKGQLLAKVNDRQLQAQLDRLEAQIPLAEDRVFRQNALLQRDAVSKEAYEQVKTELATLNADIENVKASIALTELRAPFDGIIGLRQVSTGAYASPNVVVAKLTRITPLKVEFAVPERYAKQIRKGTSLSFKIEGRLDAYQAQVYATESSIDPATHTLNVRALYPNPHGELLPGRYASIELNQNEIKNAIAIPSEAIVPEMGQNKVFVYHHGVAEPVDVEIGIRTEAEVQILRGLSIGDTILTTGTLQLRTGMPVIIDHIN